MFDHCIYFNTAALARVLERKWAEAFAPFGLTAPQGFALRLVLAQPGSLQYELADQLGISRPTLTRLLDGLEGKSLVVRQASARDGRELHIFPTPAAEAIRLQLEASARGTTQGIKALVGKDVFENTVKSLRTIRSAVG